MQAIYNLKRRVELYLAKFKKVYSVTYQLRTFSPPTATYVSAYTTWGAKRRVGFARRVLKCELLSSAN